MAHKLVMNWALIDCFYEFFSDKNIEFKRVFVGELLVR